MQYDLSLPVAAGIAGGIALIVAFSLYSSNLPIMSPKTQVAYSGIPVDETRNNLVAIAMNVSGIKAWSPIGWRWLTTDMLYGPNGEAHGIVRLKLPSSFPTPKYCVEGWEAMVDINIQTLQVESTDYPAIGHDDCGGINLQGPAETPITQAHTTNSIVTIPRGASDFNSGLNFEPKTIKVVIGVNNTVEWKNLDIVPSTISSDSGYIDAVSGNFTSLVQPQVQGGYLLPGESFNFTFTQPGSYGYHSEPHPWMQGTVVVSSP